MTVTKCPVCGTDETRYGVKFADREDPEASVVGHIQGSSDDDHAGIGYEKAKRLVGLNDDGGDGGDPVGAGAEGTASSDDDGGGIGGEAGLTPFMPESDSSGSGGGRDTAECPVCGVDLGMTEAEARAMIEKHGGAECKSCGEVLTYE